ncbi:MAG: IclR family transcriptional regulator [Proteobacteria bacterium]|nr:IclR family transcriptional regulator [Pseudomonadota bacterium]MBS0495925.1 IclR family transcriptional regulator [Pseudomonadota bacterium]
MTYEDRPSDDKPDHPSGHIKEDRHFVTALARGLEVLHAFKSGEERLGNQDLAERCQLPKSTVTRLTYTLTKLGYLHQVPASGRYRLGLMALTLGGTTLSRLDVKEVSNPLLQQLANDTDTMVALAIRDNLSMFYIENCRSEHSIVTLRMGIGTHMPLGTTAAGRGYLAAAPQGARRALEARLQAIDPAGWPKAEQGIRQAMADLAEFGCVCSFGDWRPDVNAIAVPIRLSAGLPLMVVNAGAAAGLISAEVFMNEVRPKLLAAAHRIEAQYQAQAQAAEHGAAAPRRRGSATRSRS